MTEYSFIVELVVDKELFGLFGIGPDLHLGSHIFVKSRQMCGYAGVQPTDDLIEHLFLLADCMLSVVALAASEAILLVDHLPYC